MRMRQRAIKVERESQKQQHRFAAQMCHSFSCAPLIGDPKHCSHTPLLLSVPSQFASICCTEVASGRHIGARQPPSPQNKQASDYESEDVDHCIARPLYNTGSADHARSSSCSLSGTRTSTHHKADPFSRTCISPSSACLAVPVARPPLDLRQPAPHLTRPRRRRAAVRPELVALRGPSVYRTAAGSC